MTRKQALIKVCEYFEQEKEDSIEHQIIREKLQEIINDMPLTNWTEAIIFDTLDQWINEHGRLPTTKDMNRKGLPPIAVIKRRFGMKFNDFLSKYYSEWEPKCNSVKYGSKTENEWREIFQSEFSRIKPFSAQMYNFNRQAGIPAWNTFAKIFGVTTWTQLLSYCDITPIKRPQKPYIRKHKPLQVAHHIDIVEQINKLDNQ